MRHRFTISIYGDNLIDREVLDYIFSHDSRKRQDIFRALIRAGYSSLVQHKNNQEAMLSSVDEDIASIVLQSISGDIERQAADNKSISNNEKPKIKADEKAKNLVVRDVPKNKKPKPEDKDLDIGKKEIYERENEYQYPVSSDLVNQDYNIQVFSDDDLLDIDPSIEYSNIESDSNNEFIDPLGDKNKGIEQNSRNEDDGEMVIEDPMAKLSMFL